MHPEHGLRTTADARTSICNASFRVQDSSYERSSPLLKAKSARLVAPLYQSANPCVMLSHWSRFGKKEPSSWRSEMQSPQKKGHWSGNQRCFLTAPSPRIKQYLAATGSSGPAKTLLLRRGGEDQEQAKPALLDHGRRLACLSTQDRRLPPAPPATSHIPHGLVILQNRPRRAVISHNLSRAQHGLWGFRKLFASAG